VHPTRPNSGLEEVANTFGPHEKGFDGRTCTGPLGNKRTVVLGRIGSDRMKELQCMKAPNQIPRIRLICYLF
jgi:hypothetical protein